MLPVTRKKSTTTVTTRMADQVLSCSLFPEKKKGNESSTADSTDQKKDPLASQVWRMYAQAKDSLPNGSRLENLTWRMMAMTLKKEGDTNSSETMDSESENGENNIVSSKSSPMVQRYLIFHILRSNSL